MVAFVTSAAELDLRPRQPVYTPAIGSPLAFGAPAGAAAPLVVDFAPVYDLRISPRWAELAEWIPGTIFRCIGLGTVAQVWGGLLAGLPAAGGPSRPRRYRGAAQSALVVMFRIDQFLEPAEFRAQMDLLARQLKELAPLEGFDRASYAGDIERQREREFRRLGIPLGPEHRRELEGIAGELGIAVPWRHAGAEAPGHTDLPAGG
jgi:LDH2 family malate/lactate/ureidoglycolate dehydrogenase